MNGEAKLRIREQWDRSAPGWDRWFDWYTRNFRPYIDWCCDAAAGPAAARILDLGCGAGQPAVTLAERRGQSQVIATDLSPEMVHRTRERAVRLGLSNLSARVMDAESLDFADESFDAVTFAFGLMFCPDPVRALAEIRRVLRPGGRMALTVWCGPEENPFFTAFGDCVARVISRPPPPPDAPQPFRFAAVGSLDASLREAGWDGCATKKLGVRIHCDSTAQYETIATEFAGAVKAKLDALGPADRQRLAALIHEAVAPFAGKGGLRFPAVALCVAGAR